MNSPKLKGAVKEIPDKLEFTDEGDIEEYLSVNAEQQSDNSYKLSQTLLIDHILLALGINERTKESIFLLY